MLAHMGHIPWVEEGRLQGIVLVLDTVGIDRVAGDDSHL